MKAFRVLISLAAAAAFAQPGPEHLRTDAVRTYLNLTATQLQSISQVTQQQRRAAESLLQQVVAKDQAIRDLLEKGGADAAAIGKLQLEAEALRRQVRTTETSFRDQARNRLTADQKAKLKALQDAAQLRPAAMQAAELGLLDPPAHAGRERVPHTRMPAGGGPRQRPHRQ